MVEDDAPVAPAEPAESVASKLEKAGVASSFDPNANENNNGQTSKSLRSSLRTATPKDLDITDVTAFVMQ